MPKLDQTHLSARLARQIERLKAGGCLVIRDVSAVLSPQQFAAAEAKWNDQKTLHRGTRPKNDQERIALGIKDKREIYIDALEEALREANDNALEFLKKAQAEATRRQVEIYLNAVKDAKDRGKSSEVAQNFANNELTRAGFGRLDRSSAGVNKRDREVNELENQIKAKIRNEMTEEELEQQKMLEQFLKWKNS